MDSAVKHHAVIVDALNRPWSQIQPVLIDRDQAAIVGLAEVIAIAGGVSREGVQRCQQALLWPAEKLSPPPLLTGVDLKRMGYQPGPQFRIVLDKVRQAQLNGQIESTDQAIEMARKTLPKA